MKQRDLVKWALFWLIFTPLLAAELSAGERPEAASSNIVLTVIQQAAGESIQLQIDYPEGFSDRLDMYVSTNLPSGVWVLCEAPLSTAGRDYLTWSALDAAPEGGRFYQVGNADLDTDQDGLADAREALIYRTNPQVLDTDTDGIPDGAELNRGTDPVLTSSSGIIIYADSDAGSDGYDGFSPEVAWGHGPKRSLTAASGQSYARDVIQLSGINVFRESSLCIGSRDVMLRPQGAVCIQP